MSACNVGDLGSIPGSGRSPGEGNGNPLQYSCLENPMDGRVWWATVHGVAKSRTRLHFHFHFLGFRVCHTDLEGKEKTSRESKSVFLESHQIKYPCCGISQEPVECKRVGSLEGTTMLCTQCLLMRRGHEGLGEIRDTSQAVY